MQSARAIRAIATLAFALALTLGVAQAQAQPVASPVVEQSSQDHGRLAHGKRSGYLARRVATRSGKRRHRRPPGAAPISTPSSDPKPSSTSTPITTAKSTPASKPASAPKPSPAPKPTPTPTPPSAPAPSGSVLFRGDFDAGFKDWYVQSLSTRATLFSSGSLQGTQAARFEVRAGDIEPDTGSQRSEVSGPTFDEGQDLYIRDAIRIPAANSYSASWQIIQQLHEEDWSGSPGIAVMLDNKHAVKLGAGDGSPTFWQGPVLQTDHWYDLVYRVNLSQDSGTGFIEVWLDGAPQTLANGQTRIYGQTIQAAETYLKAGIYRSKTSSGTSIVEHDAITVATSYAAATTG
jgi:Polysaccharide lyase